MQKLNVMLAPLILPLILPLTLPLTRKYESPNHAFEWGRAYFLPIIAAFIFFSNASLAASVDWREYTLANHGLSITLPSVPQSRQIVAASGDGMTHIYESFKPPEKLTKFSIFITLPENHGIFEAASMDVFLDGYIKSIAHGGQIQISRRTKFRGLPALEYQINHVPLLNFEWVMLQFWRSMRHDYAFIF